MLASVADRVMVPAYTELAEAGATQTGAIDALVRVAGRGGAGRGS